MVAIGWSVSRIAKETKTGTSNINRLLHGKTPEIFRTTDHKYKTFYDKYSMVVLSGRYPDAVKTMAKGKGWAPPLAWDDIETDIYPKFGARRA